ncbi:tRNA uridine-5-carboxymethylaminomethyl(34) synthesis GTPase MnmE [Lacrimispora sp. 210928-DFI.3.58]|uniref:tRNA uridine-5-carboxymethylaminomethyl(34) synthesis GTPase MnmE n=1 Tax=Lacrimispora sp. 210928-DFI.3.58 TaxID=2883214 RepID=UPI0015B6BD5A|nr:tRNA uridine-5-carboxymethylaminomethyl(34) synthesis GTPase MnmE [Lacrimispora sp. 210928-DFI.3.58]MCB7319380.1 tRNA uridine-5-carboxymethylaminomethyl(34) synthesis GTPase MnmE [Lacrimispora sp. 210928-DFI.3.58]
MQTDTIAAIATGMSNSGIGIVRISGDHAFEVIDRIYRNKKGEPQALSKADTHTVHYGFIYDGDEKIDEVLVLIMRGPHSYTAEDTVEIDCHGGSLVVKKILEAAIRHGARTAGPGEFTKRAFLNGRIDLSQAEAVADVINATNEYALKSSVSQLGGSVSRKIKELRGKLLYEIAFIESALDDPEHISLEGYSKKLKSSLSPMINEVKQLIQSADNGRIMSEGVKTVILGKPNAGKSSLMNVLLGEERAIVTEIAGTTRDTLEEHIYLQGISLHIVDTAGIRDTEDVVEKIGVDRAMRAAGDSDLIIYVVDGSRPLDENDKEIMEFIRGRKAIVLLNKTDLTLLVKKEELEGLTGQKVILISAKEEKGIGVLEQEIKDLFYHGELSFNDQLTITNVRHKEALEHAYESLQMVERSIEDGLPEDFYSIDLMDAYEQLGFIIGEAVDDDLVNEIFARFCMGK